MSKTLTIRFDNDEAGEMVIRRTLYAHNAYAALWEIAQEVFRPARKHGYTNSDIQAELVKAGEAGTALVHLLEKEFYTILEDHHISLEDWK